MGSGGWIGEYDGIAMEPHVLQLQSRATQLGTPAPWGIQQHHMDSTSGDTNYMLIWLFIPALYSVKADSL